MTGPLDWTLAKAATATHGVVDGDASMPIHSVSTDSRSVTSGALFVAIKGEHHDGHDFVAAAIAGGAVAGVVERGSAADILPRVEVENTTNALRDLAAARRSELDARVVAVSGSTGKTSTKDLLAAALPGSFASPRSFNNEVGVPLTVLSAADDTETLVLEVGSRGLGHIRWLAPAVLPDIAIITNLGVVHLETFGTKDALADGKFELIESLVEGGVAVLPDDEPRLVRPHPGPTITFGLTPKAGVHVSDIAVDQQGRPRFVLHADGASVAVELAMAGAHNAVNAAAAAAAALVLGLDLETIADGFATATAAPWRMEVHQGRITVVNDAYNANPDSMVAAMETVAAMPGPRIAVLGEMAELGPVTEEEHERIGRIAADLGFDVITVGRDHGLAEAAGGRNVARQSDAADIVLDEAKPGSVVLVKASRSVGLERLAAELIEEARP
ncbi:MAG: UDP-N-acetylmuramoyl-tripeptide--D-alanyl-D-alanine ligase [Actinobacteria bacterium]|nr:UDP-N-acetylmuramoyl-tripeptide--D-alanyl-D-alanine ligase [Actinomycetota bacterium]